MKLWINKFIWNFEGKHSEMKNIWGKDFLLMRDNTPCHLREETKYSELNKILECKEWSPYISYLNLMEIFSNEQIIIKKKKTYKNSDLIKEAQEAYHDISWNYIKLDLIILLRNKLNSVL